MVIYVSVQNKVDFLTERLEKLEDVETLKSDSKVQHPQSVSINVADTSVPTSLTPLDSFVAASSNTLPLQLQSQAIVPAATKSSSLPFQPLHFKSNKGTGSINKTKAANKLRVQTSRIVSSFKTSPVQCRLSKQYLAHRDGVWDVDTTHRDAWLLGTASAGIYFFVVE